MPRPVRRLRPKMMTVMAAFVGLLPIMWSTGAGADVMRHIAAPMVGGLVTPFLLGLLMENLNNRHKEGGMSKVTALILGIVLLVTGPAFAQQTPSAAQTAAQPVEVGNKICPVDGMKIGAMGPPVKYTYNGKVYNLSCPACIKSFQDNPGKYSKIAEDERNSKP